MIAECMPSATRWVGVTVMSTRWRAAPPVAGSLLSATEAA
jgi:hypothetical protein